MFIECRNHLITLLKESGIKVEPYKSRKHMKTSSGFHMGAVLFEREVLEKDLQKRIYMDTEGKKKRRKMYKREVIFRVVIGENEIGKVQDIYEIFLERLPSGIEVGKNYVEFVVAEADWLDDEDSIIKAKCAVQFMVHCIGGVYKDTSYKKYEDIKIEVEKEASLYGADNKTQ